MARTTASWGILLLLVGVAAFIPGAHAFGAGNIPSIAQVEGHNWRHGDIEDMLKTIAFLHGKKWTTMLVQRTYFGNWLRDYSQAVDVGSLKGVNAPTIRILVWVLSFLAFGYATGEFEVTEERLGVYRPEEHIDNPKGYADGEDARKYDPRLRGPIDPRELEIDTETGMKNYIANERGGWATSAGYLRFSLGRSIHFGRLYLHGGHGASGKEADLCEALRCLGQSLHCMEDFSAHSNYCELALRELGYNEVFPHCGAQSQINIRGRHVYPIVTGTFGGVDFLHSVIGEANDHFTQSEVDEVDVALKSAEQMSRSGGMGGGDGTRGFFSSSSDSSGGDFISLVAQLPGIGGGFAQEATRLQSMARQQEQENVRAGVDPNTAASSNPNHVPGMSDSFDPVDTARKIYPILEFRDKIVRSINNTISKIPGLESLLEHISETLTAFVLGLLAPFIRPIINQVSKVLKDGSSGVISASANTQLEPWTDPYCTDPTHSMLSKDHFTNVLNSCAGRVAATILTYTVPRILYAWDNPGVPVDEVINDVLRAFHHPTIRDEHVQIQRDMFDTVRRWANEYPRRNELGHLLSSQSVKDGHNHVLASGKTASGYGDHSHAGGGGGGGGGGQGHSHGSGNSLLSTLASLASGGAGGGGKAANAIFSQFQTRDLSAMDGHDDNVGIGYLSASPASSRPTSSPSYGYSHPGTTMSYNASTPSGGHADSYLRPQAVAASDRPGPGGDSGYGGQHQYQGSGGHSSHGGHGSPPQQHHQHHQHGGSYGGSPYAQQHHQHGGSYGGSSYEQQQHHHHEHEHEHEHQHQHQHQHQYQPPEQGYYGGPPQPPPGFGGGPPGGFYGGPPPPGWGGPGGPAPGYGGYGGGYGGFQGGPPPEQPSYSYQGQQPYGLPPYGQQQQQGSWGQPYQRY